MILAPRANCLVKAKNIDYKDTKARSADTTDTIPTRQKIAADEEEVGKNSNLFLFSQKCSSITNSFYYLNQGCAIFLMAGQILTSTIFCGPHL